MVIPKGWACGSGQTARGYRPTKLIDMRNTMPTGASVTITGICGHDAGICDLTPRSRWPESLVTMPEYAVTMKRNVPCVVFDDMAQILGDSDCFRLSSPSQGKPVLLGRFGVRYLGSCGLSSYPLLSVGFAGGKEIHFWGSTSIVIKCLLTACQHGLRSDDFGLYSKEFQFNSIKFNSRVDAALNRRYFFRTQAEQDVHRRVQAALRRHIGS